MNANIELIAAIKENTAETRALLQFLKEERNSSVEWAGPEKAAQILGLPLTKSKTHRRKLRWLVRQGFITQFREGRPPSYYIPELHKVSQMIRNGEIGFIGQA